MALAGCLPVGMHSQDPGLKYLDLTPGKILGVVSCNDESLLGLNTKTQHLYEIDHHTDPATGKDVCDKAEKVYSGTASNPGAAQQLISTAESSAANTTLMGWILSHFTPATNTSSSTKVTVTSAK